MTIALERATLADVDEETARKLAEAADTFRQAPKALRDVIREAGLAGEKPSAIARAIGYAYTYDYVARIVRQARRGAAQAGHPEDSAPS